jgi:hypothetical protein
MSGQYHRKGWSASLGIYINEAKLKRYARRRNQLERIEDELNKISAKNTKNAKV